MNDLQRLAEKIVNCAPIADRQAQLVFIESLLSEAMDACRGTPCFHGMTQDNCDYCKLHWKWYKAKEDLKWAYTRAAEVARTFGCVVCRDNTAAAIERLAKEKP